MKAFSIENHRKIMSFEPVSFGTQLLGTLIGVVFGFGFVMWWDRKKKKTEQQETRNLIIDSLVAELEENLNGLNNWKMPTWTKEDGKFQGDFGLASVYAFQSIVSGGDFLVLPTPLQKGIRDIYQHCELFNKFMDDIIHYSSLNIANLQDSKAVGELLRRLLERKTTLQASIPDSIKELKSLKKKGRIEPN